MDVEYTEYTPKSYPTNLIQKDWTKRICYLRHEKKEFLDKLYELEVREDDVWIVTLPKCGTTWMQELVWLLLNNLNFEAAKSKHQELRSPFLEFLNFVDNDLDKCFEQIEKLESPRLIKTHLPLPLLPAQLWTKKAKIVYVYRNPKDMLVSEYHHLQIFGKNLDETLEQFVYDSISEKHEKDMIFEHVTEFYALRNDSSWLYYTSFECMKKDLRKVVEDLCKFLNKSINEQQMEKLLHHLSFEEMKKNPTTNHLWEIEQIREKSKLPSKPTNFIRKGKVGAYREELSPECIAKVDEWILRKLEPYQLSLNQLLLQEEDTSSNLAHQPDVI